MEQLDLDLRPHRPCPPKIFYVEVIRRGSNLFQRKRFIKRSFFIKKGRKASGGKERGSGGKEFPPAAFRPRSPAPRGRPLPNVSLCEALPQKVLSSEPNIFRANFVGTPPSRVGGLFPVYNNYTLTTFFYNNLLLFSPF